ncbi:archaemetzincin [Chitinophaga eiseniae]|uniref:Archaemetzincin n=1 Tax=Chitinophaga eiseniae TaxID=634771 RepID=A0A1T4Q097_9BACT|nr:archaemetzincin [Chitinophaga eiseniae]SJZ96931.1 archaemetzincin [Chitinophaga eiseniae]
MSVFNILFPHPWLKPRTILRLMTVTLLLLSCKSRQADPVIAAQCHYFDGVAGNDIALGPPQEGDWRFTHHEKEQTYEAYKAARPAKPSATRSVIYLLPVGDFTPLQEKILEATREYTAIFFQQQTVLLPARADAGFPPNTFRQQEDGHTQLLAPYILDSLLKGDIPPDGLALMAITARDLFPKSDWNYVFGLASYADRVGVTSIYRFQNGTPDSASYIPCLMRLNKIASHEIGHMFSLHHCLHVRCVMNGTNNLRETDSAPARLCSDCQKKLYRSLRYDNQKRLQQLTDYCRQQGLQPDYRLLKKDLDAIQ